MSLATKKIHPEYWLYLFVIVHFLAWSLAPALVRLNLPMDAMEGTTWGHQFEWGYDKNPFMNAWLTVLAVKIGGQSAIYFFSQISVALCFLALFQLGKKMLTPIQAVVSVLLLEGVQYYSFHAIDFNDNTLELGFWALTILFFYQAVTRQTLKDWILTGVFAAFSMMTKYFTVVLLLPMFLFLMHQTARESFKQINFYIGVLCYFIIIAPHFVWLFSHQFVTVDYALNRVDSPPTLWNHVFFPAQFLWQQFETMLPVLILVLVFFVGFRKRHSTQPTIHLDRFLRNPKNLTAFNKAFLLFVGLGPFLLTVLLSVFTGIKLRAGWGQPLLSMWGLLFIFWLRPQISPKKFYCFVSVIFILLALMVFGYTNALRKAAYPSSANYPGKNIALLLTNEWHKQFSTDLKYVAGSRWLAGNIAFYSKDQPTVYIDWDKTVSPWIDEKKLKHDGAIFVWDLSENNEVPIEEIKKRFPKMGNVQKMQFAWLRNKTMAPTEINVAFLPPEQSESSQK